MKNVLNRKKKKPLSSLTHGTAVPVVKPKWQDTKGWARLTPIVNYSRSSLKEFISWRGLNCLCYRLSAEGSLSRCKVLFTRKLYMNKANNKLQGRAEVVSILTDISVEGVSNLVLDCQLITASYIRLPWASPELSPETGTGLRPKTS